MLLNVDSSGASVSVGPTVAAAEVSLASVSAKDFTVSQIQRFAAPFKVVHDSSCSSAPTLDLGLAVTINSVAAGVIYCTLQTANMKAPIGGGRKQLRGTITVVGGPYSCIALMLKDTGCSQVSRLVHLNRANGDCYCATGDSGFTSTTSDSDTDMWFAPVAGQRCV